MDIPYEILIKYCRKETTQHENEIVMQWLSKEENYVVWDELKKEWAYIDDKSMVIPDNELVWNNITSEINKSKKRPQNRKKNIFIPFMSSAAVITMLAISSVIYLYNNPVMTELPEQFTTITTKASDKSVLDLPDGTSLWINSGTQVSFSNRFNTGKREINLDGEIFLDVMPSEKPFVISTDKVKVEVLGTSFNIKAYSRDENIEIELVSGKIAVSDLMDNRIMELNELQNLYINKSDLSYSVESGKSQYSNLWMNDNLVIDNKPLNDVIEMLEKWYGYEIIHTGLDTEKYYTFTLGNENIHEFLDLFSFLSPIDYKIIDNKIFIEAKKEE